MAAKSDPPPYTEAVKEEGAKSKQGDYPPSQDDCCTRGVKQYVGFSLFRFILHRLGRLREAEDPDLDIEHHIPSSGAHFRRASLVRIDNKRIRCYRCLILCIVSFWLFFMYGVAIAMVLTGVFQTSLCSLDNNLIVIYLIVSGVTTVVFLLMRFGICGTQVCVSCYKQHRPGAYFAYSMCMLEMITFVVLLFLTIWTAVGVYFIYVRNPGSLEPALRMQCDQSVYIPATIFLTLQLLLIPFTLLTGMIVCCGAKRCCCLYDEDIDSPPFRRPPADKSSKPPANAGESETTTTQATEASQNNS